MPECLRNCGHDQNAATSDNSIRKWIKCHSYYTVAKEPDCVVSLPYDFVIGQNFKKNDGLTTRQRF